MCVGKKKGSGSREWGTGGLGDWGMGGMRGVRGVGEGKGVGEGREWGGEEVGEVEWETGEGEEGGGRDGQGQKEGRELY